MKINNEQKPIRIRGNVQLLLENLFKKFPLILNQSTRRDRNAIRTRFSSYKCTINNKKNSFY